MKSAIIYTRVSTGDQAEKGASLVNQEQRCLAWAALNNVSVVNIFREEGVSAKTSNRPKMNEMFKYLTISGKNLDYLIIYEIDRLTRNASDYFAIKDFIAKYGVTLKDPSNQLETTYSDKFMHGIKAIIAEVDNDMKSDRVRENMKSHANNGELMNKAPYGLENCRDYMGRSTCRPILSISEPIAMLLVEFSTGSYRVHHLLRKASQIGLKQSNGKPMTHQILRKILTNPLYAGLSKSTHTDGQLVASIFDGIVPREIYFKNQEILNNKSTSTIRSYKVINPDFPLRGFMRCSKCDQPVRGSSSTNGRSDKKYPKYDCHSSGCRRSSASPAELHSQFKEMMDAITPNPDTTSLIKTLIVRIWHDEVKKQRSMLEKLHKRQNVLKNAKIQAIDKVIDGSLTVEDKKIWELNVNDELIEINKNINHLDNTIGTDIGAIDYVLNFMGNIRKLWSDANTESKIQYQQLVFPKGVIYDFNKHELGTTEISPLFRLVETKNAHKIDDKYTLVIPRRIELRLPD